MAHAANANWRGDRGESGYGKRGFIRASHLDGLVPAATITAYVLDAAGG